MDSTGILQVFLAIITVVVIAGFAGVLYFLSRIERALAGEQQKGAPATTVAHREPDRVVQAVQEQAPPLRAIDPREMGSLEEYLGAIGEKYNLASFTLATSDGLLIGSTRPDAQGEAAQYSHLYTQGKLRDETGAELLGIPYRGETVIGIVRPSEHLPADMMSALEQDTRDALRQWV
jgi:hypothetical protein